MKLQSDLSKQRMRNRLNRLEGQIHGINHMIDEERECAEVLQQLTAARSALQGTIEVFTEQMVNDCLLSDNISKEERCKLAAEMLAVIHKT
ncbi:MAG TPA: metal-sensitive transcriptional regulator [Anaerolineaceae bacterium]|nr:metal-sensitive transcriptional regulator [Anaerolineaceae bacterium]